MTHTIRVLKADDTWLILPCKIASKPNEPVELEVPGWGRWLITVQGMYGNVGGNDWRIYTLHEEDCARLVAAAQN